LQTGHAQAKLVASFALGQVRIPSLKPVFTSSLLRICGFNDSTADDYDVATSIMDNLQTEVPVDSDAGIRRKG